MQSKLIQALHSKTVWTTIIMLVFNVIPSLNIDQSFKDLINGVLVVLISYFHINPAVQGMYTPAGVTPPVTPPVIVPTTSPGTATPTVIP